MHESNPFKLKEDSLSPVCLTQSKNVRRILFKERFTANKIRKKTSNIGKTKLQRVSRFKFVSFACFCYFQFLVALTKNLFVVLDNIWTSSISKKDKLNIIKSVSKMERKNGRLIKNQIPQGTPFFDAITMNGDQLKLKSHYY